MPKPTNERAIKQEELVDEGYEPLEIDSVEEARKTVLEIFNGSAAMPGNEPAMEEAVNDLIQEVDKAALHAIREEISVYYPEQLFSPIPYMSFRCGNLWYKTVVLPGETSEEAYKRAWDYVAKQVQDQFIQCKKEFWQRQQSMMM